MTEEFEFEFYQDPGADYRSRCEPGQFFWAPVPYLPPDVQVRALRLDYYDPAKPHNASFIVETVDIATFRPGEDLKPLEPFRLASDEFILCLTYKIRPVIVLSRTAPRWQDSRRKHDDNYIVLPIYSVKDRAGNYRFSEEFLLKVQAYQYCTLFYLPEDIEYDVNESLVRLDRALAVPRDFLRPRKAMLTEDALFFLSRWLHYYLGDDLDPILEYQRGAKLKALQKTSERD